MVPGATWAVIMGTIVAASLGMDAVYVHIHISYLTPNTGSDLIHQFWFLGTQMADADCGQVRLCKICLTTPGPP